MKKLLLSTLVALWAIACLGGWIILGSTILNTSEWWFAGFWLAAGVFVTPILTYNFTEEQ